MATILFSHDVGQTLEQMTIAAGPAVTTSKIELNVDTGANVTDGNATVSPRPIKKSEILEALLQFEQAVLKSTTFTND